MPTRPHTHGPADAPLMGHALVNHLTDDHDLDYRDVTNHSVAWRNGVHDDLHQVHPAAPQPDVVEHVHTGYWPRGEEARLHLIHAHGYTAEQSFGLTLSSAELDHHTEHQPVPPAREFVRRLRVRDTHPVNVLVHRPVRPGPSATPEQQAAVSSTVEATLAYLQGVESEAQSTWVLLSNDGIEAVLNSLDDVQQAGDDVAMQDAATNLAANVDKTLGVHS